jgi:hypothetical protein
MGLNNGTSGLSQGDGLAWIDGLSGGPGLTVTVAGQIAPALLLETTGYILLEDGGPILLEG